MIIIGSRSSSFSARSMMILTIFNQTLSLLFSASGPRKRVSKKREIITIQFQRWWDHNIDLKCCSFYHQNQLNKAVHFPKLAQRDVGCFVLPCTLYTVQPCVGKNIGEEQSEKSFTLRFQIRNMFWGNLLLLWRRHARCRFWMFLLVSAHLTTLDLLD